MDKKEPSNQAGLTKTGGEMNKKITLTITLMLAACFLSAAPAQAHLVAFGWNDNGNGTISMFGQHWHGDQSAPSTANGGVRIGVFGTGTEAEAATWPLFQWTGFFNNQGGDTAGLNAMVTAGTLDGYATLPGLFTDNADENDWFTTDPLVLGNGTWGLFTGTNCCIDTMNAPGQFIISGISSVPEGTGPGQVPNGVVPEPATMALLGSGLLGFAGLRRKNA